MRRPLAAAISLFLVFGSLTISPAQETSGQIDKAEALDPDSARPAGSADAGSAAASQPGQSGVIRPLKIIPDWKLSGGAVPYTSAAVPGLAAGEPRWPQGERRTAPGRLAFAAGGSRRTVLLAVGLGMFAGGFYFMVTPCSDRPVTVGGVATTVKECHKWRQFVGAGLMAGGGLVGAMGR